MLASGFLYDEADGERQGDKSWLAGRRETGKRTALPSSVWAEPIDLMEHKAPLRDVARAWIETDKRVRAYFAGSLK